MKITIESTSQIVTIVQGVAEITARVWEGQTESGIKVACLIPRIVARRADDLTQFEAELKEQPVATAALFAFPLRMIL